MTTPPPRPRRAARATSLSDERRAAVFKALSDPRRLRIVEVLAARGEVSGSEIAEATGMSLALMCHHWNILHAAGVITKRKVGQRTYCTLNRELLRSALERWVRE